MGPIPYGRQHITQQDIDSVIEVLGSDYLTQGPRIKAFEEAFAQYVGSCHAVAVANGTAALHLCTLALDVQPGDQVITTPITFAASANCVRYCGGEVLFADIDPRTYLLDIEAVRQLLERDTERKIKGVIPVDFAGRSVDMEAFRSLASEYDCWIIEDACHAPGGHFRDSQKNSVKCGSGQYADLAIFSFHPVKHIASGEGGMITTNNPDLYARLMTLRTHGITRDPEVFENTIEFASASTETQYDWPGWYMEMTELGYNYRLSDIQAALGHSQLNRADAGLQKRRAIAQNYEKAFLDKNYLLGQSGVIEGHAYHLYVIEVQDRLELYKHLRANKVYAQIHYIPTHLMPYYKKLGWDEGMMPCAEKYYQHCISLPMYPTLTDEEQQFVIDLINDFYKTN